MNNQDPQPFWFYSFLRFLKIPMIILYGKCTRNSVMARWKKGRSKLGVCKETYEQINQTKINKNALKK